MSIDVNGEGENGEGTDLVITLGSGRRIRRRGPFIETTTTRRLPPGALYDPRYTEPSPLETTTVTGPQPAMHRHAGRL